MFEECSGITRLFVRSSVPNLGICPLNPHVFAVHREAFGKPVSSSRSEAECVMCGCIYTR